MKQIIPFKKEITFKTMISKIRKITDAEIFITTLGYSNYTGNKYKEENRISYNEELRKIASELKCGIVPLDDYITETSYSFYLGDFLHYNAKGAELLSLIYEKAIKEYFGIEFDKEIKVEHKEQLPEGVIGKIVATSNTNFWGNYANNVFLVDSSFTNPQFSYRIEIIKDKVNKDNIDVLKGIPIAGICVVSAIMKADDPKQAAVELKARAKELGLC